MKFSFTLILFTLSLNLGGQIIINNNVTPAVGDSFYYAIDTNALSVINGLPGVNQTWDFSHLKRNSARSDVYRNPDAGANRASFPSADVMGLQGVNELYYKVYANRIELLGTGTRGGGGPIPGIGGATVFAKPAVVQRYPQRYRDTLAYQTTNSIKLAADIIPDSILNTLPIKPDSFRINFTTRFRKEVDAWGKLSLPAKTWDVQRELQVTTNSTTVDAKVAFFGWIDITTLASGIFQGFFGSFTTYNYAYVSNETKGLIALVSVDSMGNTQNVQYKPDDKIVLKTQNTGTVLNLDLFPNPSSDVVYLSSDNLPFGQYQLMVIDKNGKSHLNQSVQIYKAEQYTLNINLLPAGSYIVQLIDQKNSVYTSGVFQKL
jgi:hypothetical protein